jgi:small neutral amino acid transporter SnatA (MarC family)
MVEVLRNVSAVLQASGLLTAALFPIVNPVGSAVVVSAMVDKFDRSLQVRLARQISIYSFFLLFMSMLCGGGILSFFGVSLYSVQIGGGLVVAINSWFLLAKQDADDDQPSMTVDAIMMRAFYPLTLPFTVGPGSVSVAVALGAHLPAELHTKPFSPLIFISATLGSAAICLMVYFCYCWAEPAEHLLGSTGTTAGIRLSSFISLCIGVRRRVIRFCIPKIPGDPMKHRRIPGLINVFEVSDPDAIRAVAKDPVMDRGFETQTCPFNWFLLKRSLNVLSFNGIRFPTMAPRRCPSRARAQEELARNLDRQVAEIKGGPMSLQPLAEWLTGVGSDAEVGILTQQVLGRLFRNDFVATPESWAAALVLVKAPRSSNLLELMWWFTTGKVRRAKRVLAGMVGNDLSAVNAIGIAVHNIVKGLDHMRSLYSDIGVRNSLSAEAAANECLRAPVSVYRQSTEAGTVLGTRFAKHSLFALKIGLASRVRVGRPLVFMEDTWSQCPASKWVPALFEGVWRRVANAAAGGQIRDSEPNAEARSAVTFASAANGGENYANID